MGDAVDDAVVVNTLGGCQPQGFLVLTQPNTGRSWPAMSSNFGEPSTPVLCIALQSGGYDVVAPQMPVVAQLTGGHRLAAAAAAAVIEKVVDMLAKGTVNTALGMDTLGVAFDHRVSKVTSITVLNATDGGPAGTRGLYVGPVHPTNIPYAKLNAEVHAGNPAMQMYVTLYAGLAIATAVLMESPDLYTTKPDLYHLCRVPTRLNVQDLSITLHEMAAVCSLTDSRSVAVLPGVSG